MVAWRFLKKDSGNCPRLQRRAAEEKDKDPVRPLQATEPQHQPGDYQTGPFIHTSYCPNSHPTLDSTYYAYRWSGSSITETRPPYCLGSRHRDGVNNRRFNAAQHISRNTSIVMGTTEWDLTSKKPRKSFWAWLEERRIFFRRHDELFPPMASSPTAVATASPPDHETYTGTDQSR